MATRKQYFKTHVSAVNGRIATAIKDTLSSEEIGYVKLFKGMINRTGGLGAKKEINSGGSRGIYGEPNLSTLYSSTDFPTIKADTEGAVIYSDGSMMISKVTSSMGSYIQNEQAAIERLKNDVDALFMAHAAMDDKVLIGGVEKLSMQNIYGLGNHPDIGRIDNTTGKLFKDMTAVEIYTELKAQIQDFVANVNPEGSLKQTPIREITLVFTPDIYLIVAMAEIVVGSETINVIDKLKKDMAVLGGLRVINNGAVAEIKHEDPALADTTRCAIIGYFDKQYVEAEIPAPTNLLAGANGDASHIDNKTEYESLFASKNLGVNIKNIGAGDSKKRPLRIMQGL